MPPTSCDHDWLRQPLLPPELPVTYWTVAAACGDRDQRRRTASVCGELMLLRRFFPCGAAAGSELINQSAGCKCGGNGRRRVQDYGDVPTLAARMREPGL